MDNEGRSIEDRIKKYLEQGWDLDPIPYRIRNADLSPGPWKAKVNVMHHSYHETTMLPITGLTKYPDMDRAQYVSVLMGLDWLEKNA